mmetsp:Transcript_25352/g.76677  ORF Transcript_25352/g.76677 Transcript_25352/m.76677 type:complete len:236 (+) Transcript_25352:157-864(+)
MAHHPKRKRLFPSLPLALPLAAFFCRTNESAGSGSRGRALELRQLRLQRLDLLGLVCRLLRIDLLGLVCRLLRIGVRLRLGLRLGRRLLLLLGKRPKLGLESLLFLLGPREPGSLGRRAVFGRRLRCRLRRLLDFDADRDGRLRLAWRRRGRLGDQERQHLAVPAGLHVAHVFQVEGQVERDGLGPLDATLISSRGHDPELRDVRVRRNHLDLTAGRHGELESDRVAEIGPVSLS